MELDRLYGLPRDTTPEAYRVQCEILRRLTPEQRSRLMIDLMDAVNQTVADGVRRRHPDYAPEQVRLAVIRLRLGDELFRKVYPGVEVSP